MITLLYVLTYALPAALGQTVTHAVCSNPEFLWAFNSIDQSPCQIGEALGNVCTSDNSFNIQPIPEGFHYSGVSALAATTCVCNQVYFSLLSACAACQGAGVSAWDRWNINCTIAYSTYPNVIPDGTAVPHYAYLPLFSNGTFDFLSAINDNGPEATPGTDPSNTSRLVSSSTSGPSSTSQASSSASSGGSKSNAGAIAGGVVGGVVFLALIGALLLYFFVLRPKKNNQNGADIMKDIDSDQGVHPFDVHAPQMSGVGSGPIQKIYDPNDPSTFPLTSSTTPSKQTFVSSPLPSPDGQKYTPPPYGLSQMPSSPVLSSTSDHGGLNYRGVPEL